MLIGKILKYLQSFQHGYLTVTCIDFNIVPCMYEFFQYKYLLQPTALGAKVYTKT